MARDSYKCVVGTLGGQDKSPLSEAEMRGLIARFKKKVSDKQAAGNMSSAEIDAAEELAKEARIAAMLSERTTKLNLAARVAGIADIDTFKTPGAGLAALIQGSKERGWGKRESVQSLHRGRRSMYIGQFVGELYREGLLGAVLPRLVGREDAVFDEAVAVEMDALSRGVAPGSSKNEAAAKIARIANKYFELARKHQNSLGAWIAKTPGYVMAQSHDMMKLRATTRDEWIKFIRPLLDETRTFDGVKPKKEGGDAHINEFLTKVYDELSSGAWYRTEQTGAASGFKGAANLAKRLSASRVLHFKGPKEFTKYNGQFGVGTVFEGMVAHLERGARSAALLERFGVNWRDNVEWLRTHYLEKAISNDNKKVVDELKDGRYFGVLMDIADGTANVPTNIHAADWQQAYLRVQRMASLGAVMVSSMGDVATAADELRFQGMSFTGSLAEHTGNILSQVAGGNEGLRNAASHLGIGFDAYISSIISRWEFGDSVSKKLARTEHKFFWLTGMNWHQNANERSMSVMMAHNLAANAHLAHANLDPQLKQVLSLYKIGEKEWEVLRTHGVTEMDGGHKVVTGDTVRLMAPEGVDELIDVQLAEVKDRVTRRMSKINDKMIKSSERIERLERQLGAMGDRATEADRKTVRYTMDALRRQHEAQKTLMDKLEALSEDTMVRGKGAPLAPDDKKVLDFNKVWRTLRREMEFLSKAEVGVGRKWADGLRGISKRMRLDKLAEPAVLSAIEDAADVVEAMRLEIAGLPDAFDKSVEALRFSAIDNLERKLQSYYMDRTAVGIPRAGIKEQYALTGAGQRPGTGWGFLSRAMMQFKGYGVSFINEVLGRYAQEDKFWRVLPSLVRVPLGEKMQVAGLITTLTALGYMSLSTKALLKGRTPPEIFDDENNPNFLTFGKAMVQGGGFGLYGDFLSATSNRFGESFLASAGGPIAGDVESLAKMIGQTSRWANGGAPPDDQVWSFLKGNTPFINLFYTRAALDYMILYDVQEALSPGSLRRMEDNLKSDSGVEFLAPPSEGRVKLFTE